MNICWSHSHLWKERLLKTQSSLERTSADRTVISGKNVCWSQSHLWKERLLIAKSSLERTSADRKVISRKNVCWPHRVISRRNVCMSGYAGRAAGWASPPTPAPRTASSHLQGLNALITTQGHLWKQRPSNCTVISGNNPLLTALLSLEITPF